MHRRPVGRLTAMHSAWVTRAAAIASSSAGAFPAKSGKSRWQWESTNTGVVGSCVDVRRRFGLRADLAHRNAEPSASERAPDGSHPLALRAEGPCSPFARSPGSTLAPSASAPPWLIVTPSCRPHAATRDRSLPLPFGRGPGSPLAPSASAPPWLIVTPSCRPHAATRDRSHPPSLRPGPRLPARAVGLRAALADRHAELSASCGDSRSVAPPSLRPGPRLPARAAT